MAIAHDAHPDAVATADVQQPFTLWFETLPTSDTARLLVWPRAEQVRVVFFWNHEFHSQRSFATLEAAESWGRDLHRVIQQDALAGMLLGYDPDVLEQLQARCSAT